MDSLIYVSVDAWGSFYLTVWGSHHVIIYLRARVVSAAATGDARSGHLLLRRALASVLSWFLPSSTTGYYWVLRVHLALPLERPFLGTGRGDSVSRTRSAGRRSVGPLARLVAGAACQDRASWALRGANRKQVLSVACSFLPGTNFSDVSRKES